MKYLKLFENIKNSERFFTEEDFYCIKDRFQDIIDEWDIEFQPGREVFAHLDSIGKSLRYYFNFLSPNNMIVPKKSKELTIDNCTHIYLSICFPRRYFYNLSNDITKYNKFMSDIDAFVDVIKDINPNWVIEKKNSFATDTTMLFIYFKKYKRII